MSLPILSILTACQCLHEVQIRINSLLTSRQLVHAQSAVMSTRRQKLDEFAQGKIDAERLTVGSIMPGVRAVPALTSSLPASMIALCESVTGFSVTSCNNHTLALASELFAD